MFRKNDLVIYGNNGVCTIKDIGPLDIPGVSPGRIYYTLIPYYSKDSQIFLPVDNQKVTMRQLIQKEELLRLIDEVPSIEPLWIQDEKQREVKYKEALRKCDCRELIRIIKTIYQRKQSRIAVGKKMTASDEKYFHLAEEKLYGECAIALGMERIQVQAFIDKKLRQTEVTQIV